MLVVAVPVSLFELQADVCVWVVVVVIPLPPPWLFVVVVVEHVFVESADAMPGAMSAPVAVPATRMRGTMRRRIMMSSFWAWNGPAHP